MKEFSVKKNHSLKIRKTWRKYIHWYVWVFTQSLYFWQDMMQDEFFKLGKVGLKSEFSFSKTSFINKVKGTNLPYDLFREKNKWFYAFLNGINMKWKANNLVQDLNNNKANLTYIS